MQAAVAVNDIEVVAARLPQRAGMSLDGQTDAEGRGLAPAANAAPDLV